MAYGNENTQNQGLTSEGNQSENTTNASTPIPLSISGSEQNFDLKKKVISNQQAKENLANTFNEVVISEEKFDSEKINVIYNDLFYQIPKKGKKSHSHIIEESTDYVYPEINENLENKISSIENEITDLNEVFLFNSLPQTASQHPIYDNGLLLQEGDPMSNQTVEPGSDVWYMQEGLKRKITHPSVGYYKRLLRQANGEEVYDGNGNYIPSDMGPNFRYLSPEDLNSISNGEDISGAGSLNKTPIEKIGDEFIYSDIDLEIKCLGVERFYKFKNGEDGYDYDLSEYEHNGTEGGYWWLDTEASCRVEYETDQDPTTTFKRKNHVITWPANHNDGIINISISRDVKYYDYFLNNTNNPLDPDFYDVDANVVRRNMAAIPNKIPATTIWKKYGSGNIFPSITKATGRLTYRIKNPQVKDASGDYNPVDGGKSHWLKGLIVGSDYSAVSQKGMLDSYYNKKSKYGTRMIWASGCHGPLGEEGCYGDFGSIPSALRNMFSNHDNRYYLDNVDGRNYEFTNKFAGIVINRHKVKGKIYGQPIIRVNGHYCVFLEAYRVRYVSTLFGDFHADYNVFYRLKDGHIFRIKNKNLDDSVTGYKRMHNDLFNWLAEEGKTYMNNPTIYFPGLKGYSINFENTDLDHTPETSYIGILLTNVFGNLIQNLLSVYSDIIHSATGFSFNFMGSQLKDNPFNPKNGGSNYEWRLKSLTKTG